METTPFPHDSAYKSLFNYPEMVKSLLQDFVPRDFIQHCDFSTLEPCKSSFVAPDMRQRHNDILWRVKGRTEWCYIYLMLEFQSSEDHLMALRIQTYSILLWIDRAKQGLINGKLPPIFPIVLYNGDTPWTAPQNTLELVEPLYDSLIEYQPTQKYWLIDEKRVSRKLLDSAKGVAAYVIKAEQAKGGKAIYDLAFDFVKGQDTSASPGFRHDMLDWLERRIEKIDPKWLKATGKQNNRKGKGMLEELVLEHVNKVNALEEEYRNEGRQQGIAQGLQQGRAEGMQQGRAEGMQQGRAEGMQQGMRQGIEQQRTILLEMLEMRFGNVPEKWRDTISRLSDADSLKELIKSILITETTEEFSSLLEKLPLAHRQ